MRADQDGLVGFDGHDCLLLEGVQLERVLLGFGVSAEDFPLVSLGEIDLVNAALLRPRGLDLYVFESLGEILVFAVGVFLWKEGLLVVFEVDVFVGKGVVGGRMRAVDGLLENGKRVLLLHC